MSTVIKRIYDDDNDDDDDDAKFFRVTLFCFSSLRNELF